MLDLTKKVKFFKKRGRHEVPSSGEEKPKEKKEREMTWQDLDLGTETDEYINCIV